MFYEKLKKEYGDEVTVCHSGKDENLAPGVRYGPVIRDIFIVECCTAGFGTVIINGKEFSVKRGDCYFLFPGDTVEHTADFSYPREGVWCAIDGFCIGSTLRRANISSTFPFAPREAFDEITYCVTEICDMQKEKGSWADLKRTSLVYSVLSSLLKYSPNVSDKNIYIQKAQGYMEANYDKNISVDKIASEVGLDRSWFSVLFKEQTSMTPHAYLTMLRIKKACFLMKNQNFSVADTARATGLDGRNFSRLFKKETGLTPTQYLKNEVKRM